MKNPQVELYELLESLSVYLKDLSESQRFLIVSEDTSTFFKDKIAKPAPILKPILTKVEIAKPQTAKSTITPPIHKKERQLEENPLKTKASSESPPYTMNKALQAMVEKTLPSLTVIEKIPDLTKLSQKPKTQKAIALILHENKELAASFINLKEAIQNHFGPCELMACDDIASLSSAALPRFIICSEETQKTLPASFSSSTIITIYPGTFESKDLKKDLWKRIVQQLSPP